jgi:hypothetical protein
MIMVQSVVLPEVMVYGTYTSTAPKSPLQMREWWWHVRNDGDKVLVAR